MKKVFKQLFLFLICGICLVGIERTRAMTPGWHLYTEFPNKITFDENGNTKLNIRFYKYNKNFGDVNNDGNLDIDDVESILEYVNRDAEAGGTENDQYIEVNGDLNNSGLIEKEDAEIVLKNLLSLSNDLNKMSKKIINLDESLGYPYAFDYDVQYAVFNGDSVSYNSVKEYYERASKTTTSDNYNALLMDRANLFSISGESIAGETLKTSDDMSTLEINIGKTKVDKIYLYIGANISLKESAGNGYSNTGNYSYVIKEYDVSDFDWDAYLNKNSQDIKEETVENPSTGLYIGIGGFALVLLSLVTMKKKNKFSRL